MKNGSDKQPWPSPQPPEELVLKETAGTQDDPARCLTPEFTQQLTAIFHRAKRRALSDEPPDGSRD